MAFLNISKDNKELIEQIDRTNYFGLHNSGVERMDLYTFAVALGYNQGYPSDLRHATSLVREERAKEFTIRYAFSSLFFNDVISKGEGSVEDLTSSEKVFPLADRYANTGFSALADLMKDYSSEQLTYELLSLIDEANEVFKKDRAH